jgi:hypothetical protein
MDYAGLLAKFRTSRPLTPAEHRYQLHQKERLDLEPHYQFSVIRLNSTYLELVDKWYGARGMLTAIALIGFLIAGGVFALMGLSLLIGLVDGTSPYQDSAIPFYNGIAMLLMVAPIGWGMWKVLRAESFSFTHYPMRFNRITGMVHVYRVDGTVLSVPWREIYFTLAQVDHLHKFWNILGHLMEADQVSVKETFALSMSEVGTPEGILLMRSHWEFFRRYMEDGPSSVAGQVEFCLPLVGRRESLIFGARRLLLRNTGQSICSPITWLSIAFDIVQIPFRWISIRTSKIPVWPAEIESTCSIADNDPFAIDGSATGERRALFPDAAEHADVRFTGPPKNPLVSAMGRSAKAADRSMPPGEPARHKRGSRKHR